MAGAAPLTVRGAVRRALHPPVHDPRFWIVQGLVILIAIFHEGADAAGIVSFDRGRGAAIADLSLDGLLDIVEVNYGAPVRIWRNVGTGSAGHSGAMGNWLELRVAQGPPNVDAIGAWVEVRTGDRVQRRELTIGGGHASGQLGWIHFGLGAATDADVRVTWPGAEAGSWQPVRANTFAVSRRGASSAEIWSPRTD
jgi:hypothetical protein